jgi:hypothetical protein
MRALAVFKTRPGIRLTCADDVASDNLGMYSARSSMKSAIVWSASWASTPARRCANCRPGSWPRTRRSPQRAPADPAPVRAAAPSAAGNLRERLSSFVGRDAELEQLREAVRSSRLVTLTGPGGTGKTRLAVEAVALRAEYQDGAWLVELAGVAAPDGDPAAAHQGSRACEDDAADQDHSRAVTGFL